MRKLYIAFVSAFLFFFVSTNRADAQCTENFDGVVAPALPAGWTAITLTDCAGSNPWATSSSSFDSPPNAAFANDPNCISDEVLVSGTININSPTAQLTFRRNVNLESTFDGAVLEISIGGGPFQDILAAGGSFVTGGYNGTISVNFGNPIGGRQAWTGNSGGWATTTINLPAAANGQSVVIRWRRATDSSVSGTGISIDNISFTGCVVLGECAEAFDNAVAPAVPPMWTVTTNIDCANSNPWATVSSTFDSPPNSAFVNDPNCISDEWLDSRPFAIVSPTAQLTFRRNNNLENGFDGMVLEISIGGGPFQDILVAGGSFVTGGYNGTISVNFSSPILGRQAWTGNTGGWVTTTVNLPAAANGQNIVLRWRRGTDSSVSGTGAFIDGITITGSLCALDVCNGNPFPGTITGPATACFDNSVMLELNGQSTALGVSIQWKSSTTPGGPYTNISGATGTSYTFNAPATTTYYIATLTCSNGGGTSNTPEFMLGVGNLVHSNVSSQVTTLCSPGTATVTGTASGGYLAGVSVLGTSGTINLAIPDNSPAGANSVITLPATTFTNPADLMVRINARHSWTGDLRFSLTSPCGTTFLFDRPGVPLTTNGNSDNLGTSNAATPPPAVYTFDLGAATVLPETSTGPGFIPSGSYQPSDVNGAAHNWTGLTFPCSGGGNWTLNVQDNAFLDQGMLIDWQILGPAVYTHSLTGGPGTITQNASTGAANATGNFTITNIPFGTHTYTLTSTDPIGCSVSSEVTFTINQTPVITFTPPSATICNGNIQQITANVVPPIKQTFSQPATTNIPAGQPVNSSGPGSPYASTITVAGLPTGAVVRSVRLGNFNHTFPDDVDIVLVSPAGTPVILMSDAGGGTDAVAQDYVLDDAAASALADNALNPAGTYRPTNYGTPDAFAAPGPGSLSQANPTLASFGNGNHNGTWSLYVVDDAGGDVGYLGNWNITFDVPPTVVFSPTTGLYTNSAATIPYTGTPVTVVWAKPTTTTVYTATTTVNGCSSNNTITVTVNQPPAITVQPAPATQTVCPGFNVNYTVTATGTGLTYQWKRNGTDLVNNAQISGATSNSLTITGVTAANAGTYTVVVSGTCPPAVTSANAVLVVATTPVISTQPANTVKCVGQTATFTVATTGSVPAPNIFQWQVSTDGGVNWTDLTTNGSYTNTLTVPNVTLAMNNYRYRVIVTNFCGQTVTSTGAILTVTNPNVTVQALPSAICISDTLVPLVGTPVGGSWTGIGVSGFNFVPSATAAGTYTLTYTYTDPSGCVSSATTTAKVVDCPERLRLLRDDAVVIFPNPNNGLFNFRMNSTLYNYLGMRVYDTRGKLILVKDWGGLVYGRVVPVDLTHLPAGTYMVKLYYDDGVRTSEKTFPVVIQH